MCKQQPFARVSNCATSNAAWRVTAPCARALPVPPMAGKHCSRLPGELASFANVAWRSIDSCSAGQGRVHNGVRGAHARHRWVLLLLMGAAGLVGAAVASGCCWASGCCPAVGCSCAGGCSPAAVSLPCFTGCSPAAVSLPCCGVIARAARHGAAVAAAEGEGWVACVAGHHTCRSPATSLCTDMSACSPPLQPFRR